MTYATRSSEGYAQTFRQSVSATATQSASASARTISRPATREPEVAQTRRFVTQREYDAAAFTPDAIYSAPPAEPGRIMGQVPGERAPATSDGGPSDLPGGGQMPLYDELPTQTGPVDERGQGTTRTMEIGGGVLAGLALGLGAMWLIRRM